MKKKGLRWKNGIAKALFHPMFKPKTIPNKKKQKKEKHKHDYRQTEES